MGLKQINSNTAVDTNTGEKLIKREAWVKRNQIVRVIDVNNQKNVKHVKFRTAKEQKRLFDQLSLDESGLLLKLLAYMDWETNSIVGDGVLGEKNKPLKWVEIDKILHCSKRKRIDLVASLEKKKVIGYMVVADKKTSIVVNPKFAINGYKPADSLLKSFESEEDVFNDPDEE